jgi:biotin-[acetyl-CoA-carboxylase] ligase BirA-like protein
LWFTVATPQGRIAALSLFLALPLLRVLDRYASGLGAKWPNDLCAPGRQKLGGVLVEVSNWTFMGVGINVNNTIPAALADKATTLSALTGRTIDREALLGELLEALQDDLPRYQEEGFARFRSSYEARLLSLGETVTVKTEGEVQGILRGVRDDGCLLLETGGGLQAIASGTLVDF